MKTISVNEFQARCLALLDDVLNFHETLIITRYEQPVARIIPIVSEQKETINPLKNSIVTEEDIVTPLDTLWNATQ